MISMIAPFLGDFYWAREYVTYYTPYLCLKPMLCTRTRPSRDREAKVMMIIVWRRVRDIRSWCKIGRVVALGATPCQNTQRLIRGWEYEH